MPQGGAMQSLTPIGPLDFLAETAMTGASQMENMNPLAMLLAGALAPGAYKKLKTTNTPALLKKFDVKVDNPLYHNTNVHGARNILKEGKIKLLGKDLCRPCKHLQELIGYNNIVKEFPLKGGLRCEIINSGTIYLNDEIKI